MSYNWKSENAFDYSENGQWNNIALSPYSKNQCFVSVDFQFNDKNDTKQQSLRWFNLPVYPEEVNESITTSYSSTDIIGRPGTIASYNNTSDETKSFSLHMHREISTGGNGALKDINEIDAIVALLKSAQYPKFFSDGTYAPIVTYKFGDTLIVGKQTSIGVKWSGPKILGAYMEVVCNISVALTPKVVIDFEDVRSSNPRGYGNFDIIMQNKFLNPDDTTDESISFDDSLSGKTKAFSSQFRSSDLLVNYSYSDEELERLRQKLTDAEAGVIEANKNNETNDSMINETNQFLGNIIKPEDQDIDGWNRNLLTGNFDEDGRQSSYWRQVYDNIKESSNYDENTLNMIDAAINRLKEEEDWHENESNKIKEYNKTIEEESKNFEPYTEQWNEYQARKAANENKKENEKEEVPKEPEPTVENTTEEQAKKPNTRYEVKMDDKGNVWSEVYDENTGELMFSNKPPESEEKKDDENKDKENNDDENNKKLNNNYF